MNTRNKYILCKKLNNIALILGVNSHKINDVVFTPFKYCIHIYLYICSPDI